MNVRQVGREERVGYLVPEFPGQTHAFFWRELALLQQLHISPDVVSTRSPGGRLARQDWAAAAQAVTTYLAPMSITAAARTLGQLLSVSPRTAGELLRVVGVATVEQSRSVAAGSPFSAFVGQLGWVVMGARLASLAKDRDWRHVHVHSCGNSSYVAMYANVLTGLPYSLTLHGPLSDYGCNQRLKWTRATFAVVITEGLRQDIESSLGSSLPGTVEVAPMGVDLLEFSRDAPYRPWSGDGPFRIFSCGRLNRSKGHDVLLGAVHKMVRSGADVQLTIAGEDEDGGTGYRQDLEHLIDARGLNNRVRLLGAVPTASVRTELNRAHVFTLASHAEPLGVAIMEAMSMGVPIVATASGGVPELVEDKVSGLLVAPGNPELLAESLLGIMENPNLSLQLGRAGRHRVEASFDYQRSAKVLARLVHAANIKEDESAQSV